MKKMTLLLLMAVIFGHTAQAGVQRKVEAFYITNGAATLTVPTSSDTFVGRATTDTLTNKSISGSSNTFTNIPAATALTGQVPVANGGTGLSSVATNGILYGQGSSALAVASAGSQYQSFIAGSGGVPAFSAVALNQSAAVSGQLAVANGGTGASTLTANNLIVGNGSSAVTFIAPGTSGYVLTSNGSVWSAQPPSSGAPSLNGGSGSPQAVTAAGGVVLTSISYENFAWVVGSPGAVTVTATPSVTACTADGQKLHIVGTDATNTVTLQDEAGLAGSKLQLNGTWVGGLYSVLNLHCDITLGMWVEDSRR